MALFRKSKTEEKKKDEKKEVVKKSAKVDSDKKQAEKKKQSMKDLYSEGKPTVVTTKDTKKGKKVRKYGNAYRVLIRPLVTEKATNLGAENKYVFEVARNANKIEIAKAITEVYGVKPTGINIIKLRGKNVRYGRVTGRRKDWKKAIVTLPSGQSIKVYEGV